MRSTRALPAGKWPRPSCRRRRTTDIGFFSKPFRLIFEKGGELPIKDPRQLDVAFAWLDPRSVLGPGHGAPLGSLRIDSRWSIACRPDVKAAGVGRGDHPASRVDGFAPWHRAGQVPRPWPPRWSDPRRDGTPCGGRDRHDTRRSRTGPPESMGRGTADTSRSLASGSDWNDRYGWCRRGTPGNPAHGGCRD